MPSLLAALDHAVTVIATRHPYRPVLLLHAYREEAIALALLLVERQCLEASDGTMAEVLFGMRRAMHGVRMPSASIQHAHTRCVVRFFTTAIVFYIPGPP